MAGKTSIEWTKGDDGTAGSVWNPLRGCSRVSPGCGGANHQGGCYAEKIAARFSGPGQPFLGFAERTEHGTPTKQHCRASERNQANSAGRACGPLSEPAITVLPKAAHRARQQAADRAVAGGPAGTGVPGMTTAYPLAWPAGWPRAKTRNRNVPFSVTPDKAVASLYRELRKIGATHLVVSSNAPLRNDGTPYRDALSERLKDPGVAVYFQRNARPMVMAQDAYSMPYANIRSLALAVEAMRAIERHGGGHMMERSFAGFAQLPPPGSGATAQLRPWREVLGTLDIDTVPAGYGASIVEAKYRELARKAHPDAGGSAEAMAELNAAIDQARRELS